MTAYSPYSDTELIELLRTGDKLAFTEIYKRHWEGALNAAFKRLKSKPDAEEIVLSVNYPALRMLMDRYPVIFDTLLQAVIANERYYYRQTRLIQISVSERFILFRKENPLFARVATQQLMAMHMGMSLRCYTALLSRLNKNGNTQI